MRRTSPSEGPRAEKSLGPRGQWQLGGALEQGQVNTAAPGGGERPWTPPRPTPALRCNPLQKGTPTTRGAQLAHRPAWDDGLNGGLPMASTQAPDPQPRVDAWPQGDGHRGLREVATVFHTTDQGFGGVHRAETTRQPACLSS